MSQDSQPATPEGSLLGKPASYVDHYDASLLYPLPRLPKRLELGLTAEATLPFMGVDIWHAYELGWLNRRGKPQIAIARFLVPASSPNIIESKSFKLYLNSLSNTAFDDIDAVRTTLGADLSAACGAPVSVRLMPPAEFGKAAFGEFDGLSLDRLDIETDIYQPAPALLKADHEMALVEETLVSDLLKSNCLVTGQPDWGSVQIRYVGAPIDQEGLLKYLISFRNHNEFHEQCVERIFVDIMARCKPAKLAVFARYTRRGGLDINPLRANYNIDFPDDRRSARQ